MAKKRKTRSQKFATDLKHQVLTQSPIPSSTISLSDIGIKTDKTISTPNTPNKSPLHHEEYTYVKHDLRKTSMITGAIILVELVLFFVVKR